MQLSLQRLRQEKDGMLELEEHVKLESLAREVPGLVQLEPVEVRAKVSLLDPHLIQADVRQSARAKLTCSRCLAEFEALMQSDWVEQFTDEAHRAVDTEEEEIHLIAGE